MPLLLITKSRRRTGGNVVSRNGFPCFPSLVISIACLSAGSECEVAEIPVLREAHGPLVWRGALDAVDDEDLDRILGGDEPEAELRFERAGERGSIGSAGGAGIAERRPGEAGDVEVAAEARVVDDRTVPDFIADGAGQHLHFYRASLEDAKAVAVKSRHQSAGRQWVAGGHWRVTGFALRRRGDLGDFEAALGRHELIDRQNAALKMRLKVEAVGEEALLHHAGLLDVVLAGHFLERGLEIVRDLAVDEVGVLVEPVRTADNLWGVNGAVGVHDVAADAQRAERSTWREPDHAAGGIGIERLDGGDLVGGQRTGRVEEEQARA